MQVNMNLFIVLTVFAFITEAKGAVTQCYSCLEMNTAQCDAERVMFDCSNDTFPNIGNTHCYTASAYYMQGGQKLSGVARGCGNCSNAAAMTEASKMSFKMKFNEQLNATLNLASFNVMCCNDNNCNNQTVTPSSSASSVSSSVSSSVGIGSSTQPSATPTSHATRLFPVSGIMAFVAIILAVTL